MRGQSLILDLRVHHRYLAEEMSAHPVLPDPSRLRPAPLSGGRPFPVSLPALRHYYAELLHQFGPQKWWPGRTRFEIIAGAILTQNTSWVNVEGAIRNLKRHRLLTPVALERIDVENLATLIRSSGYFRQKARKLKAFVTFLRERHQGSLSRMFRVPTEILREELLGIHGIGPETADSILLYAGNHPSFVIDAYTRRILERHQLASGKESYDHLRDLFQQSLPRQAALFNEYHALMVRTGKNHCRARGPLCSTCPLERFLPASVEGAR